MAYESNGSFSLPCTVSYLPNNLSCISNHVSFAKFNEIHVSNYSSGESNKVTLNAKTSIFHATLARAHDDIYVVVASSEGTHIYLAEGLELQFFLPIGVSANDDTVDPAYACGVGSNADEGFIFTGTSSGNITVLQVPPLGSGRDISFHSTIQTSDFPIFSLASSTELIATGNDNGDVFAFSASGGTEFARKSKFPGSGSPCTGIATQHNMVFAAFSLGNIKVYNTSRNELSMEVTAHARSIYGLCVHPTLPILASCSDDQHLHVWSSDNMDLLSSHLVDNRKLTGVAFFPRNDIGVSSYDCDEVALFSSS